MDPNQSEEEKEQRERQERFEKLQWRLKCQKYSFDTSRGEIENEEYPTWIQEVSKKNYQVEITRLESKRSIQSKLVEFMIDKILSKDCIFLLVDILFKDMKEDYELIEGDSESGDSDEAPAAEQANESGEDEESGDDLDSASLEEYIALKGVLTIERVKDIVGEIICSCPKTVKFEVMQKIIRNMRQVPR